MSQYGKVEYWNERYDVDHETFSWYQKYEGFRHLLTPDYLSSALPPAAISAAGKGGVADGEDNTIDKKTARVLIVGAGNDELGEEMIKDGWEGGIVNVDFSSVVIQQMKEKYDDAFYEGLEKKLQAKKEDGAGKDGGSSDVVTKKMIFDCHDVTKPLPYVDGSFDLIICKGTLDAILCSAGSAHSARAFMEESCRILNNDHGVLVTVTYGNKESRLVHFENNTRRTTNEEWWKGGVTFHSVPKPVVDRDSPRFAARKANPFHTVIIAKKYGTCGPNGDASSNNSPTSVQADDTSMRALGSSFEKRLFIGIPEDEEGCE